MERPPPLVGTSSLSIPAAETLACANCGTGLTGPFCSHCGQHVADFHRSVWRFVAEFFDNTLCWDNKLFLTLEPLFKQPGFLTREFMLGRRVRYVHPLRLFLFTSAVCLTLLQYSHTLVQIDSQHDKPDKKHKGIQMHFGDAAAEGVQVHIGDQPSPVPAPVGPGPADASPSVVPTPGVVDKKADGKTGKDPDDDDDAVGNAIKRAVADKVAGSGKDGEAKMSAAAGKMDLAASKMEQAAAKLNEPGGARRLSRAITEGVQQRLSWVALALLPVFALGLRSLYWRKDAYYFEHLIFSLHYHAFLLLFWTAYVGALVAAAYLPLHSLFETIVRLGLLLPPIYLYLALRRMYGEGAKRTLLKVFVLGSMHLLAIVIGVAAVGAAAFFSAIK